MVASCMLFLVKDIQVLSTLGRSAHPWKHTQVMCQRTWLSRLLACHGHHHLFDDHVLRREERSRHGLYQYPGLVLVHHRHHDHARVTLMSFVYLVS